MENIIYEKESKKIDIWKIIWYFIIYSIIGFLIETVFAIFTKGVIESRQSFLYGPFCLIYGIGAIAMILSLKNVRNYFLLFFGGAVVGGVIEYFGSLIGEIVLGVKWWDYSDMVLNIHGRTCLFYLVCWGILSIVLMKYINPKVDRIIDYLQSSIRIFKLVSTIATIFLVFNFLVTGYALKSFYLRVVKEHNLNVIDKEQVSMEYEKMYNNENMSNIIYKYFGNEKMLKTYPNVIIEDENNNLIHVDKLFGDITPYYVKLGKK